MRESATMTRRERERIQQRDTILAAAERVFGEYGFSEAKMEDIAREAEYAVGTLYNKFRNKEELFGALMGFRTEQFDQRLRPILRDETPPSYKAVAVLRARFDLFWEYPLFFRLFFQQAGAAICQRQTAYAKDVMDRYDAFQAELGRVFEAGVISGEFRRLSVAAMVMVYESAIRSYFEYICKHDIQERDPSLEDDIVQTLVHGFVPPDGSAG